MTSLVENRKKTAAPIVEKKYLSPRQLSQRWDCSRTTAQRILERAGISKYFLGEGKNGTVRYCLDEIEKYEESRRIGFSTH